MTQIYHPQPTPKKKMGIGKKLLIGLGIFFIIGVIANMGESGATNSSTTSTGETKESAAPKMATVGEAIRTDYFDIGLHKYSLNDFVNTGNQFSDLKQQPGMKYLVITATWRNTDKESRMISEGSVFIDVDGQEYEFDKTEAVMAEGWGALLEQVNPLTNHSTRLVYKIPADVKGTMYWQPGRNSDNTRFLLGKI